MKFHLWKKKFGKHKCFIELIGLEPIKEKTEEKIKKYNYIKDKKSIEEMQMKVKQKKYLKRPFKEKKLYEGKESWMKVWAIITNFQMIISWENVSMLY